MRVRGDAYSRVRMYQLASKQLLVACSRSALLHMHSDKLFKVGTVYSKKVYSCTHSFENRGILQRVLARALTLSH
jgi:hypothetical protein